MSLDVDIRVTSGDFELEARFVAPRGVVAIVGPNGAGKTTLLRAIAGLMGRQGDVSLDGREGTEGRVGFVWQDLLLFPHLDVADNIGFGLRCRGRTRAEARITAAGLLDEAGMSALARRRPQELSRGQAQRVALLRAMAVGPDLLLLDEPFSSLDRHNKIEARRRLGRDLHGFTGVTMVVTHDPRDLLWMCDGVVVVESGHVVQAGTPYELAADPGSGYVADMDGLVPLRGRGSGDHVGVGGHRLEVAAEVDGEVAVVIDPRAVALYRHPPEGSPRNVWQARVVSIRAIGPRCRVAVGGPLDLVAEVTQASVERLGLVPGTPVWVSVKATEVQVYPV